MKISADKLLQNIVIDSRQQYALYLKTKQGIIEQYGGKGTNSYTNFRMASVTKQFVAFSVLTLIESGAVNINTNMSQIFDDLPKYMKNITIRHLLTHTSGLVDYEDRPKIGRKQITDPKVFAYLKTLKRAYFKPGTKYRYSNGGYIILGQIIEKASGKKLPFFVHNAILSPAGMHNSVIYTKGVSVTASRYTAMNHWLDKYRHGVDSIMNNPVATSARFLKNSSDAMQNWVSDAAMDILKDLSGIKNIDS